MKWGSDSNNFMATYFITGSDEAGVKREASALAAKVSAGLDEFGVDTIDGATGSFDESVARIEETAMSLQCYPFFGGRKVVWLKNATCFSDGPGGRPAEVSPALDALLAIATALLPSTVDFILSAPCPDKRRAHYKQFSQAFKTQVVDLPDFGFNSSEEDIVRWVLTQSREQNIALDDESAALLAARVGARPRQLLNEFEKLSIAGGEERISAQLVRSLVPATREGSVFEMGEAISRRDPKMAMQTLQTLFAQKESPVAILLASIVPTVRNLLAARELVEFYNIPHGDSGAAGNAIKRMSATDVAHLPKKKDGAVNSYGLGLAAARCTKYSLEELQSALEMCAETNISLISGECVPEVALQQTILEILSRR